MARSGFIAIVGRPNVGKSTLLNAIMGEKIAIVSKKPQTTRTEIKGILTEGDKQYIFLDTPGMHRPKTKLGERMIKSIRGAMASVNGALLVVEPNPRPGDIELGILTKLKAQKVPVILVINKTDKVSPLLVAQTIEAYAPLAEFVSVIPISAMKKDGVDIVLRECEPFLCEESFYFPPDIITDQPERQIAAEVIREKLLRILDDEIPHGTAVVIESFEESKSMIKIRAEIFCEKASHKGIIIGKQGATLKQIGSYAREDLEAFFDTKVFLELWVKVKENWRDSEFNLRHLGFKPNED